MMVATESEEPGILIWLLNSENIGGMETGDYNGECSLLSSIRAAETAIIHSTVAPQQRRLQ